MLVYKKAMKGQQRRSISRSNTRFIPTVDLNIGQVQQLRRQSVLGQSLNSKQTDAGSEGNTTANWEEA